MATDVLDACALKGHCNALLYDAVCPLLTVEGILEDWIEEGQTPYALLEKAHRLKPVLTQDVGKPATQSPLLHNCRLWKRRRRCSDPYPSGVWPLSA
jgi:hypothetical protein